MRHAPAAIAGLLLCLGLAGCGPSDPLAEIRKQQAAGDLAGSLAPLRELLAERPDDAEVQYLYGRALALTGQPSLAQWSLRNAMDDPEWLVRAGLQLALGALRTQDYATAIEATGRVLEAEPENVNALALRANAHAYSSSKEQKERALADVERILELDPDNIETFEPRILALLELERIEEAGEAIGELGDRIEETQLGPGSQAWHCATTAIFADESGDVELARERWADCLERYPAHANVVGNAVQFYDARGQSDRSLEILRKALEEAPSQSSYRSALAQRLRATGDSEQAEGLLREGAELAQGPAAVLAWLELAEHHQALGDYAAGAEAAERAMEVAEEVGFSHPHLLLEYADALVVAGELDRALAVTDEMTLPAYRELVRARVFQERGQPEKALEHFAEAFRLWPDNAAARYQAALAAEASGDFDRAIEEYRYAIRIDPRATDARTRLARLYAAEGKPAVALQVLRVLADRAPLDLDGELLSLRLWAQLARDAPLERSLGRFRAQRPDQLGRALASAAEGARERAGPAAGVRVLRGARGVDLGDPRNADALRALVRLSHEAGRLEEAKASLRAALRAHPEAGALHEIQGLALELGGAPGGEVREAYARALALEPGNARPLAGLGRLALARDAAEASALFDRAAAADPSDVELRRAAAGALVASGQPRAAEERLESLLADHPYDAAAAAQLATLQLERGVSTQRTLELAQRAVRFGGGADVLDLLGRVHRHRNEPERATEAAARARALRERERPDA